MKSRIWIFQGFPKKSSKWMENIVLFHGNLGNDLRIFSHDNNNCNAPGYELPGSQQRSKCQTGRLGKLLPNNFPNNGSRSMPKGVFGTMITE